MNMNLVTVCTGEYPVEYARKLYDRMRQVSNIDFNAVCITDRPNEVLTFANPIVPTIDLPHWWNKMHLYGPQMPAGRNLYIDLDVVILNGFDEELEHIVTHLDTEGDRIVIFRDPIKWHNNNYNSSFMVFESGRHQRIYDRFIADKDSIMQMWDGGDQVWVGLITRPPVLYLDLIFQDMKQSLKFHLGEKMENGQWRFPTEISTNVKLLDCSGRPKPHELSDLPYINRNWTSI